MSRDQLTALDAELRTQTLAGGTVGERRESFARFMLEMQPLPAGVRVSPARLGGVRALRIEPADEPRPGTILYFHGGAWTLGSPETEAALAAELTLRTGVPAVSVDYRLAPEHPWPAGADDALAAYRELLEEVEPGSVVVAGASAGGGMAVAALLAARDAGLPLPAGAVLFSPGLDMSRSGPA